MLSYRRHLPSPHSLQSCGQVSGLSWPSQMLFPQKPRSGLEDCSSAGGLGRSAAGSCSTKQPVTRTKIAAHSTFMVLLLRRRTGGVVQVRSTTHHDAHRGRAGRSMHLGNRWMQLLAPPGSRDLEAGRYSARWEGRSSGRPRRPVVHARSRRRLSPHLSNCADAPACVETYRCRAAATSTRVRPTIVDCIRRSKIVLGRRG